MELSFIWDILSNLLLLGTHLLMPTILQYEYPSKSFTKYYVKCCWFFQCARVEAVAAQPLTAILHALARFSEIIYCTDIWHSLNSLR